MRLYSITSGADITAPALAVEIKGRYLWAESAAEAYGFTPRRRETLATMKSYLNGWPKTEGYLRELLQMIAEDPKPITQTNCLLSADKVEINVPVPEPQKILCVGLNYRDHCEEQNKPVPKFPIIFNKFPTSLLPAGEEIPLPLKVDKNIDYEAELAFIIGKRASKVSKKKAMDYVAGYMCMNDVSARSLQAAERQWARAKGFDGSAPCGPYMVTPDEVDDPHKLDIRCTLNGEVMQSSNTRHLVFQVPDLIAHITQMITLEPGDIVSTGTPGGVGQYREPQVFLQPGDEVVVEIERVGRLVNRCRKA